MYDLFLKRLIDFIISIVALFILSPLLLLVILLLFITNGGKPFFLQPRPGRSSRIFNIVKFKTMNDKRDILNNLLPDVERLTPIGLFIRKTSLDEIPQLFNVIIGDMSLVGPRPLLVEYLDLYNDEQRRRHEVRPGITGWAQVNGRNAISWKEKFELDVWYVDHLSISLDLKIILLTIKKVFKREGISSNTSVTVEKFNGD